MTTTTKTNQTNETTKTMLSLAYADMAANLDAVKALLPSVARTAYADADAMTIGIKYGRGDDVIDVSWTYDDIVNDAPRKLHRVKALAADACKAIDGAADARDVYLYQACALAYRCIVDGKIMRAASRLAATARTKTPDADADYDDVCDILDTVLSVICYTDATELYRTRPGKMSGHEKRLLPVYAVWYADAAAASTPDLGKIAAENDFALDKLVELIRDHNVNGKDKVRAVQNVYGYFASAWRSTDAALAPLRMAATENDVATLAEIFGRKYKRTKNGVPELAPAASKTLIVQFYLHMVKVLSLAEIDQRRLDKARAEKAALESEKALKRAAKNEKARAARAAKKAAQAAEQAEKPEEPAA